MLPGRLWKGKGVLMVSDWEIILTFNDSHRWDGGVLHREELGHSKGHLAAVDKR